MHVDIVGRGGSLTLPVLQAADVLIDDDTKAVCAGKLSRLLLLHPLQPGTEMEQVRPPPRTPVY